MALALACQSAENTEAGPAGIMDQVASLYGAAGASSMLDGESARSSGGRRLSGLVLTVIDTSVRHNQPPVAATGTAAGNAPGGCPARVCEPPDGDVRQVAELARRARPRRVLGRREPVHRERPRDARRRTSAGRSGGAPVPCSPPRTRRSVTTSRSPHPSSTWRSTLVVGQRGAGGADDGGGFGGCGAGVVRRSDEGRCGCRCGGPTGTEAGPSLSVLPVQPCGRREPPWRNAGIWSDPVCATCVAITRKHREEHAWHDLPSAPGAARPARLAGCRRDRAGGRGRRHRIPGRRRARPGRCRRRPCRGSSRQRAGGYADLRGQSVPGVHVESLGPTRGPPRPCETRHRGCLASAADQALRQLAILVPKRSGRSGRWCWRPRLRAPRVVRGERKCARGKGNSPPRGCRCHGAPLRLGEDWVPETWTERGVELAGAPVNGPYQAHPAGSRRRPLFRSERADAARPFVRARRDDGGGATESGSPGKAGSAGNLFPMAHLLLSRRGGAL